MEAQLITVVAAIGGVVALAILIAVSKAKDTVNIDISFELR